MLTAAHETRETILNVAERLFAERGVEAVSVRDIIRAAGVNLGAVNYHFHTKDLLVLEVFARRLEPVNSNRLARLNALEAEAHGEPLRLESVLEAFIRPAIEDDTTGEHHQAFLQLMSRCLQEPCEELNAFVDRQFDELARKFNTAILRAVPGMTFGELFWHLNFLVGALHHALSIWARMDHYPIVGWKGERPRRPGCVEFVERLVVSTAASMRAAVSSHPAKTA